MQHRSYGLHKTAVHIWGEGKAKREEQVLCISTLQLMVSLRRMNPSMTMKKIKQNNVQQDFTMCHYYSLCFFIFFIFFILANEMSCAPCGILS